MPLIRTVQRLLRNRGKGLFDSLAKPDTVSQILLEPYAITEAVDDILVDVLLTPLLEPGACDVVFDTLSYSAGPLPEQQLSDARFPAESCPVWVGYGDEDPWTPIPRVRQLAALGPVQNVVKFEGVGHCPHDEAPDVVNRLLLEFLDTIYSNQAEPEKKKQNWWSRVFPSD
jgi:pimeloyl-ACP methyl ester carboxylesterase